MTANGQAQPVREDAYSPGGQLQMLSEGGTLRERYFYEHGNVKCVTRPSESNCGGPTLESHS